jgi:hypothetical protein
MERKFTREPEREARVPSVGRTRVRSRGYRLERELARDLAVLVQAGLIAPVGAAGDTGDAKLRFRVTEIEDITTAGDIPIPAAADEEHGRCGMPTGR